jgi:hypothetical protein
MQMGEYDGGQIASGDADGGKAVAKQTDQRLNARTVTQEPGTKSGVDNGVAVRGFDEQAVLAAGQGGLGPAFGRDGGI